MPYNTYGAPSWPPVRHPHQLYLMAACVCAGTTGLVVQAGAQSIKSELPSALYLVWNLTLVLSGASCILAAWFARRDGVLSLLLERLGLSVVSPASLLYGFLLVRSQGEAAAFAAFMTIGFGIACLERLRECWVTIIWLHRQADVRAAAPERS